MLMLLMQLATLMYFALYIITPVAIIYIVCRVVKNRHDTNDTINEISDELDEIEAELDRQNEITFSGGKIVRLSTESRE